VALCRNCSGTIFESEKIANGRSTEESEKVAGLQIMAVWSHISEEKMPSASVI